MASRQAACGCGQLRIACEGEPIRISICHCIDCQRRTGSVFGTQARFRRDQVVKIEGKSGEYRRVADSGNALLFHFCPDCGSTVYWELASFPDLIAVAVGAFADSSFPEPRHSVYEGRRHPWALDAGNLPMEHVE